MYRQMQTNGAYTLYIRMYRYKYPRTALYIDLIDNGLFPGLPLSERRFDNMAKKKRAKHSMDLNFEVTKRLDEMGVSEPHLFLCEIMAGHDPRGAIGKLYQLIEEASKSEDEFGLPDPMFWVSIKELILEDPVLKCDPISLGKSADAAKELLEYMHPKKKRLEVTGDMEHLVKVVPLTKEEIDSFEKRFNDDF